MAIAVKVSRFSANVDEFKIVEWKAAEGDRIQAGDTLLVVETEKITMEIEAPGPGWLHLLAAEGRRLTVGTAVGMLAESVEELTRLQADHKEGKPAGTSDTVVEQTGVKHSPEVKPGADDAAKSGRPVKITPVARKLAKTHAIDIARLKGTGPGGRIVKQDVEAAVEAAKTTVSPDTTATKKGRRVKETIPLRGMQAAIAEHMHRSLTSSAQMTVMGELDMTQIVRLRKDLISREEIVGLRVSYIDIMVMILAKTLKHHPRLNASLIDDQITLWEDIHIGVSLSLGRDGLIVPVVKHADGKSLAEIGIERKTLFEKARTGRLVPDDVSGGTFTLTTVGRSAESLFQTRTL